MIQVKDSNLFKSLKSEGAIFGDAAAKLLSKRGTMRNEFTPLEKGDIIVFPSVPLYGYTKQYGAFVMVHILKAGKPENESTFQLYPGTIDRVLFPVEKDDEGIYQPVDDRPRNDGTLVDEIKKYGNYREALDAVAGKAAKVTDEDTYEVFRMGSREETQERSRYTLDFIEVSDALKPFTEAIQDKKNGK